MVLSVLSVNARDTCTTYRSCEKEVCALFVPRAGFVVVLLSLWFIFSGAVVGSRFKPNIKVGIFVSPPCLVL